MMVHFNWNYGIGSVVMSSYSRDKIPPYVYTVKWIKNRSEYIARRKGDSQYWYLHSKNGLNLAHEREVVRCLKEADNIELVYDLTEIFWNLGEGD